MIQRDQARKYILRIINRDFHAVFGKLTLVCLCVLNYIIDLRHLGVQKMNMSTSAKIYELTLIFFCHMRQFLWPFNLAIINKLTKNQIFNLHEHIFGDIEFSALNLAYGDFFNNQKTAGKAAFLRNCV